MFVLCRGTEMVGKAGFEPATKMLSASHFTDFRLYPMLYQLSYFPDREFPISYSFTTLKVRTGAIHSQSSGSTI